MKQLNTLLLVFLLSSISFGQDKQASLLIKKTADWCPFCGTYGWTFFKKVKEDTKDLPSIMIAMHYSGGLRNSTAEDLNANFSGPGQPVFFNNGRDMFVSSGNVDAKAKEYVDSLNNRASRKPNIKIETKLIPKGSQYTAQLEIENEAALSNVQYSVSLYLLRDNLIFNQASVGPNASHTNVLSGSLTPTTFGLPVYTGSVAAKTKFSVSQDFGPVTLHNGKPEDVKIAAIVWNKNAQGKYDFVNGVITPLSQLSTSVDLLTTKPAFKAYQKGNVLEIQKEQTGVIQIFNLKGEKVISSYSEENEVQIDLANFKTGLYIVQLNNNTGTTSERVFIQK